MSILDTLRRLGGCAGGVTVYKLAKASAIAANTVPGAVRKRHELKHDIVSKLQPVFPQLDLTRVRFYINASLPPNWFTSPDKVVGMTFGYSIYFKGSGYQTDPNKLSILVHELAHVEQVRRRGDSETRFACDYGKGYLQAGNYDDNPLEMEAKAFEALYMHSIWWPDGS